MKVAKLASKRSVVASSVALGLGLLMTGTARAEIYAIAFNEITNLVVTGAGAGTSLTFVLPSTENSNATACLPNGTCSSGGGAGVTDAPFQLKGALDVAYVNNSYATNYGNSASFSLADASIDQTQTGGATFTRARNMAEGQLNTNSTANANAGNSSATVFTSTFVVGGPDAQLRFVFDADPYIRAELNALSLVPSQAEGVITVNFSIQDSSGNEIFNWAPDGIVSNIIGGTELKDAFSLNTSRVALPGSIGPKFYDPLSCPVGTAGGCFEALTNQIAAGTYTLNLSMKESVNLERNHADISEPEMLGLMGLGLFGLGVFRRRRSV